MKTSNTPSALTSIIVPCWNQLPFTRQCFAALKRRTRVPWELIATDNGSTDGTASYLAGVRDMAAVPVTIISNPKNVGFPGGDQPGTARRGASTWYCSIMTSWSLMAGSIN